MRKFFLWVTLLSESLIFSGCATSSEITSFFEKYRNQFVVDDVKNYASIRGNPSWEPKTNINPHINPFVVERLDNKKLEEIPVFKISIWPDPYYSEEKLKIPSGRHTLTVRGGGYRSTRYTTFNNVEFEAGKMYVIMNQECQNDLCIYIAEYKEDVRFRPDEPESIIILKKITPEIKVGVN
ncbi:MAG: hypothetical protein WAO71_15715 [Gallionella sp.]